MNKLLRGSMRHLEAAVVKFCLERGHYRCIVRHPEYPAFIEELDRSKTRT
ncbi:MAG: hypothetical protein Q7T16_03175 [Candidatus Burarchaeum sp.]|nr:hypothetical protein [Candidatus Burarchaeum sp.]MDO8339635.1 hypothetical protein [Candidatus Burarchaeum sp.]